MNLKNASILVIIGIIYTIVIKISQYLFPDIFSYVFITNITHIFSILTSLFLILFGLYFIKEVIGQNKIHFKLTVLAALLGPAYFILLHLRELVRLSSKLSLGLYDFSPNVYNLIVTGTLKPISQIIVWLSSILICYFFFVLNKNLSMQYEDLKKAVFLVLMGTAITVVFRTFGFITYLFYPDYIFKGSPPPIILLLSILIFLFLSVVSLMFFWKLYKIEKYTDLII